MGSEGVEELDRPALVDMVVAQVDGRVITYSELLRESRLLLLRDRGIKVAEQGALSQELLASVLEAVIHRELIRAEVDRFELFEVEESEVAFRLEVLERHFAQGERLLQTLSRIGFPAPQAINELKRILRSEIVSERYLARRIKKGIEIDENLISACLAFNRVRLVGRSMSSARAEIVEVLQRQLREARLKSVLSQLKRRARVKTTPGFERREGKKKSALHCPVGDA